MKKVKMKVLLMIQKILKKKFMWNYMKILSILMRTKIV